MGLLRRALLIGGTENRPIHKELRPEIPNVIQHVDRRANIKKQPSKPLDSHNSILQRNKTDGYLNRIRHTDKNK